MNMIKVFKALANETRLQMLAWLKAPRVHFSVIECESKGIDMEKVGVCVGLIQKKAGLSQSTTSQYLAILQDAGLIIATRVGQWTYYKRNAKEIAAIVKQLKIQL